VVIVDIILPEDLTEEEKQRANHFETLRDPAHAGFASVPQLLQYFKDATPPLRLVSQKRKAGTLYHTTPGIMDARDNSNLLQNWFDLTNTNPENRRTITDALEKELAGKSGKGSRSGMHPVRGEEGKISFIHKYVVVEADRV